MVLPAFRQIDHRDGAGATVVGDTPSFRRLRRRLQEGGTRRIAGDLERAGSTVTIAGLPLFSTSRFEDVAP